VGCGGATETDLLGDPATVGNDAGKDSSTGPDGTTGKDGGIPVGDASVDDGPISVDATPIFDVIPIPDSGPKDPGVLCYTQYQPPVSTYCKAGTELCCIKQAASACVASSQSAGCLQGTRMSCDDEADCNPGSVCCGSINQIANQPPYYTEIKCAATCAVNNQVPGFRRFCDPNAPVDECTSLGLTCIASTVLPGYYACGN